jgi:hypothetical protein
VRKWLVIVGAILIGTWLILWIGAGVMSRLYTTDTERAWPLRLGTLAEARKRYPAAPASASAYTLSEQAAKLGVNISPRNQPEPPDLTPQSDMQLRRALGDYVTAQIQKTSAAIDAPPQPVADYLAAHAGDLASIRSLLLGGEEVAWSVDFGARTAPMPNFFGHMFLTRVLTSNALDRARRGEAEAWDDARAAVSLSRSLWKRPELISGMIALAIDRNVNAIARKLPLPAPAWFEEFQEFDYTRAMLATRQAESWVISEAIHAEITADDSAGEGARRLVDTVTSPYTRLCTADSLEADRRTAVAVAASKACDINLWIFARRKRELLAWWNIPGRRIATPNLDSVWQRLFRFRAELEATDRELRFRAGEPPLPQSSCSDGRWIYSANGFRFSKAMQPLPGRSHVPLEFTR